MRVIAGEAKGRPLQAPRSSATRPTSDLVKGAIFDMLAALGRRDGRVLDLYAGSGALGIEALSRGAGAAVFVDGQRQACATIQRNLQATGLVERAQVVCAPLPAALRSLAGAFDLVLLDPPYASTELDQVLDELVARRLLQPEAVVVVEHSRRREPPEPPAGLTLWRTRRHGDTGIAIYITRGQEEETRC